MHKILPLVEETLDILKKSRIEYCHFKSNEHLEAALSGDTDLDILFALDEIEKVNELFKTWIS